MQEMSSPDEGAESNNASLSGMNVDLADVKVNSNPATLSNTPSSTMQVSKLDRLSCFVFFTSEVSFDCVWIYLGGESRISGNRDAR